VHRHAGEVAKGEFLEDPAGVRGDLSVRPQEPTQQVPAADDADQHAIVADHRQPPDVAGVHQPHCGGKRRVLADRDRGRGHQLAGGERQVLPASGP
jgi:hypothetical protein